MTGATLASTVRLLPKVSAPLTLALAVLAVVDPLLGLGFIVSVGRFVGRLPDLVSGTPDGHGGWVLGLSVIAGIYVAQQAVSATATVVEWKLGQRLNHFLDDQVMTALLAPAGIGHLEDARVRDLAAEAADGLGSGRWRPTMFPSALRRVLSSGLQLALVFGAVMWVMPWLGLALAATASWALYTVIRHSIAMILELIDNAGEADARRLEYEREAAVSPASAKEVRLFGFSEWLLDRWQQRLVRMLALDLRKIARLDANLVLSVLALTVVLGGGFALTAVGAINGMIGLAAATVVAQALLTPLTQFGPGGQAAIDLTLTGRPLVAYRKLRQALTPYEPTAHTEPGPETADTTNPAPADVRLENVRFRYPASESDVLRGVDLEIPAGTSLAIVGLNGAGKTTLVKLLCRFYDPDDGRIIVDGTDLRELDPTGWQRKVAAIFQDFAKFPASVRDNVGVGALDASDERVRDAATDAGAAEFVERLSDGWQAMLGREFTSGTELSGGQWQRVALSRALLAASSGARLLVLDEPAANLDVRAEADLNERFLELTKGVTTVLISHRLSTVRQADRICVIDDGHVVESGNHEELIAAGGKYAELFALQAERFAA